LTAVDEVEEAIDAYFESVEMLNDSQSPNLEGIERKIPFPGYSPNLQVEETFEADQHDEESKTHRHSPKTSFSEKHVLSSSSRPPQCFSSIRTKDFRNSKTTLGSAFTTERQDGFMGMITSELVETGTSAELRAADSNSKDVLKVSTSCEKSSEEHQMQQTKNCLEVTNYGIPSDLCVSTITAKLVHTSTE